MTPRNIPALALLIVSLVAIAPLGAAAQNTANLPRARAGYWEVKMTDSRGRTVVRHTCTDGAAPDLNGPMARFCKMTFQRSASTIVGDGTCAMNGMHSISHIVARGDFQTAYSMDNTGTITLAGRPPMTMKQHVDARWTSACPAGMKPGALGRP